MLSTESTLIESWDEKPDLLALHSANPQRYPHLLESVAHGPYGRFDILFAFPGESLILDKNGRLSGATQTNELGFLSAFDQWWNSQRITRVPELPVPFLGGWFLYLGYELAGEIEPRLIMPGTKLDTGFPIAMATRFPSAIIRDHQLNQTYLVTEKEQANLLDTMKLDLRDLSRTGFDYSPLPPLKRVLEDPPDRYLAGIASILRYIKEGDVFQVNLSRAWEAEFVSSLTDADLYYQLRKHNPGPYNGLASWPWGSVISSSPERLVAVNDRTVQTRPIAGTRPRSRRKSTDEALSIELMEHPKEQAEHIMLIDLERNDLGRVCTPGSVKVSELMTLESYAHVHHMVSNVQGSLRPGITPGQVVAAVFPGGTVTGCPKVRCMEIITELEQETRGPYTGSMGYVNRDGDMDLNILIRTMVRTGNSLRLRAGAGIVADSDPQRELAETRAKAKGLLFALGVENSDTSGLTGLETPHQ